MKKLTLIFTIVGSSVFSFAQNAVAVRNNLSDYSLMTYNPVTEVSKQLATHAGEAMENSIAYDNDLNTMYLMKRLNGLTSLESYSVFSGKRLQSVPINGQVFGGVYLPKSKAYGFFTVTTEHNGYGNNQEEISFIAVNVGNGSTLFKTDFNSLSLNVPALPFYGKSNFSNIDPIFNEKSQTEVGISNLSYISSTNQIIFTAKDVTGTNRLIRIDANSGRVISKQAVHHNFLDFVYNADKNILQAVAFEFTEGNKVQIFSVTLDPETFRSSNRVNLSNYDKVGGSEHKVEATSIEYDLLNNYLIRHTSQKDQHYIFQLDGESGEVNDLKTSGTNTQFNYGFKSEEMKFVSFLNAANVYPNPSLGDVSVELTGLTILSVDVYDVKGQLVKKFEIRDGLNKADLNLNGLPMGVYTLAIETPGSPVFKKIVIQQ
jgi:hypothetical protein